MELETIRRQQIPAFAKLIIMNIVNNNNNKLIIIITSIINNKKKNMSDFLEGNKYNKTYILSNFNDTIHSL